MDNKDAREYTSRIAQATSTELVIIIYELIIKELEQGEKAHQAGEEDEFVKFLKRGQRFLAHIMEVLDYQYKMSYDLLSLYLYINKNIVNAIYKKDPKELKNSRDILEELKIGFEGIKDEDKLGPVMGNTQQVYAGLTYGKDKLNEINISPKDDKRGYKV